MVVFPTLLFALHVCLFKQGIVLVLGCVVQCCWVCMLKQGSVYGFGWLVNVVVTVCLIEVLS